MFIKLTQADVDNPPIILNTNHIVSVRLIGGTAVILLVTGPSIYVRESFEEIDQFLMVYDEEGDLNNTDCEMLKLVKHIASGTVP